MIIFAGLRGSDPDWTEYKVMFIHVIKNTGDGSADFGFNSLCKLFSYIIPLPIFIFFSIASISILINGLAIYRFTSLLFAALLLYFVHGFVLKEMIQIRVGLACAICIFSLYYLAKFKIRTFFLLLCVAISIHLTSIVFILAYVSWRYLKKKNLLYCLLISLFIGSFYPLGAILKLAVGIDGRLDDYIAYGDNGYAQAVGIWTNLNTIKCLGVFCLLYYNYDRLSRNSYFFEILFKSYVMGLCWLICFNDFAIIGARMSNILLSTEPILLTYPYSLFRINSRIIYSCFLIILAFVIFSANIAPNKVTPYIFYFSKLP